MVDRVVQHRGRRVLVAAGQALGALGHAQQVGQVDAAGLPAVDVGVLLQHLDLADHLLEGGEAQAGHELADLLGHRQQVAHHVLGLALEAVAQHGVLGGDAHRAGVQVADAHHHAAGGHQRGGREAHLVGAQQRGHDHVTTRSHLAVGLEHHAERRSLRISVCWVSARPISHGTPAWWIDDSRSGAGAAVVAGDHDVVRVGLDHAGGHRAHAHLGTKLHRDRRARVHAAQVVDQLLEVLDRVDVVVRRRRDQLTASEDSRRRPISAVILWPGSWPPSPGLAPCATLIWI